MFEHSYLVLLLAILFTSSICFVIFFFNPFVWTCLSIASFVVDPSLLQFGPGPNKSRKISEREKTCNHHQSVTMLWLFDHFKLKYLLHNSFRRSSQFCIGLFVSRKEAIEIIVKETVAASRTMKECRDCISISGFCIHPHSFIRLQPDGSKLCIDCISQQKCESALENFSTNRLWWD